MKRDIELGLFVTYKKSHPIAYHWELILYTYLSYSKPNNHVQIAYFIYHSTCNYKKK